MKKLISALYSNWWWSFLLFLITTIICLAYFFSINNPSETNFTFLLSSFIVLVFGITAILFISTSIYTIIRRRWVVRSFAILIFAVGGSYSAYLLLNHTFSKYQPDRFTDNLTIPDNINFHDPVGDRFKVGYSEAETLRTKYEPDFELYQTALPGIYDFVIWTGEIEKGAIFIKAYEVTSESSLSPEDIRESSALNIFNPGDKIIGFGPSTFTIQEGDWDKFYAARFEVWFTPASRKKEERKLMEKIYKIEGYSN